MPNTNVIKGYKIDFAKHQIVMNFKFAAKSQEYGSEAYNMIKKIQSDFPDFAVIVRSGRKVTNARPNKRLSYKNMESYIKVQDNCDELMAAFCIAREESLANKSPYKYVSDWFKSTFPQYNIAGGSSTNYDISHIKTTNNDRTENCA